MTCFYLKLHKILIAKVLKDLYIHIRVYKHHDLILLIEVKDHIFEPITGYPFNITLTFANY